MRRVYTVTMFPLTLPPATAAIRMLAHERCSLPYRPAYAIAPQALRTSFADVLAGSATIVVYVDAHGRALAADIVRVSDESFAPAALERLASWRYQPATCGGRPVAGRYTAVFNG
jgi:hypothetical protein